MCIDERIGEAFQGVDKARKNVLNSLVELLNEVVHALYAFPIGHIFPQPGNAAKRR